MAEASADPDWADIAAACGYADQPHLVREFAELAGSFAVAWRARRVTFLQDRAGQPCETALHNGQGVLP